MSSAEKGFFAFLKKIFAGKEKQTPEILPPHAEEKKYRHKKTREETSKDAEHLVEQLKRITPSHPAREVLGGVVFHEDTLSKNKALCDFLLDVIYEGNIDSRVYHNSDWLEKKKQQIESITASQSLSNQEQEKLERIEANLQQLEQKAKRGDERINKARQEAQAQKRGGVVPHYQEYKTASEALAGISEAHEILTATKELERLEELTPKQLDGEEKSPQHIQAQYGVMADKIQEAIKDLEQNYKQIDPENPDPKAQAERDKKFREAYEKYQVAYGKLGRAYVEKYMGGGRLTEEARGYGGMELFEKALHNDPELVDYWFYKIMEPILYNSRLEYHRELYSLYTSGEMEMLMSMLSRKRDEKGENVGKRLVDYFTTLKNTIFQAHDMDYYAAHPGQDIKEFISSTSLCLNTYIDMALQDPMVVLAKRLYEMTILQIRENHNGYIPRQYLHWEAAGKGGIKIDSMVEESLRQAIENGQLYSVKIDPVTGFSDLSYWRRKYLDVDPQNPRPITLDDLYGGHPDVSIHPRRQLGDLRIAAALKQAKGLALVDMSLLEKIGRSKGTGSDMETVKEGNYAFGSGQFNSVPYEGIVRHIEPIIHYYTRFSIGGEAYLPFFNMLITGKHTWNPDDMRRIIELHLSGDRETLRKEFGDDIDSRLIAADNPFSFSGMWGTMTKWRTSDASAGWDDWEIDRAYSTAHKLMFTGDRFIKQGEHVRKGHEPYYYAGQCEEKVKNYFLFADDQLEGADGLTAKKLYDRLKGEYRQALRDSGKWELIQEAQNEAEFERKWLRVGLDQKSPVYGKTYRKVLEKHFSEIEKRDKHLPHHRAQLQKKLERAYRARTWIKAAMRSPLIVARELKTSSYQVAGYKREGQPLRKKIIYELLGLDLDELGKDRTVAEWEQERLDLVKDVEGAVFSISQISIRENRDLRNEDFNNIKKDDVRAHAKEYWKMVRQAMLGSQTADEWYKKLGIEDADPDAPPGLRMHKINWHQVNKIIRLDNRSEELSGKYKGSILTDTQGGAFTSELLTANTIDRDWRYLFSTEDMGWEYFNIGALGERNPIRRAGDLGSHVGFNSGLEELLITLLTPELNMEEMIKQLKKMHMAMSGDDANVAVDATSKIFVAIAQMYRKADWAWKLPLGLGTLGSMLKDASIMQILHGRTHADAVGPNDMLKFIHMAEAVGIFPRKAHNPLTPGRRTFNTDWDTHMVETRLGAKPVYVIYEMLSMAIMVALLITIWRAMTAKSEEEEGGGGHR